MQVHLHFIAFPYFSRIAHEVIREVASNCFLFHLLVDMWNLSTDCDKKNSHLFDAQNYEHMTQFGCILFDISDVI
jgi:hypothetical protein